MSCRIVDPSDEAPKPIRWEDATHFPSPVSVRASGSIYAHGARRQSEQPADSTGRLRETEAEVADRVSAAFQQGRQEGESAGRAAAAGQVNAKVEQLARAIESLSTLRSRIRKEAEVDLVRLSVAIARRILRREIGVDPHALAGVIKACTERLDAREVHSVRVHPELAGPLRALLDSWRSGVDVQGDPSLPPGGLVFETSRGSTDAGVETQLNEIERGFTDLLPSEAPE
ncbi:MAG: FliH/SctL family protein [Bryobacteraceae bacterium]